MRTIRLSLHVLVILNLCVALAAREWYAVGAWLTAHFIIDSQA